MKEHNITNKPLNVIPQRKNHRSMKIEELVSKVEKKLGINQKTPVQTLKEIVKNLD